MTKFMWTAVYTGIASIRILAAACVTPKKDRNCRKLIVSNLVIFSYKEFEKFAL